MIRLKKYVFVAIDVLLQIGLIAIGCFVALCAFALLVMIHFKEVKPSPQAPYHCNAVEKKAHLPQCEIGKP